MKTFKLLFAFTFITALLASCSTSNDVVGGVFQKRKYNKGFYWNRGGVKKSDASEKDSDVASAKKTEEIRTIEPRTVNSIESGDKQIVNVSEPAAAINSPKTSDSRNNSRTHSRVSNSTRDQLVVSSEEKTVIREKKGKTIPQLLNKKQKMDSGADRDAMFILAVIFAILIPPIGVLIYTNIDWVKVLICLLLTILFFLPGMIYALLVVFDVI